MNAPLPHSQQTILALATPPGRAGVAVLRVSGAMAREVPALLGSTLPEPRVAKYACWKQTDGQTIDHGLMLFFAGPNSFTGEDVLELHCHGSMAVLETLQTRLLLQPNLRLAEPGEFSRRAYMNGKMDLLEAEGLLDLIHAETDAQRQLALAQMDGTQSAAMQGLAKNALHALALLEACIDFPDEDIPTDLWNEVLARSENLAAQLRGLLASVETGARVREGFRVVIVGPPNAGKSSLLNALSREEAAIVSPLAGTTRDAIEVRMQLAGQLVILADTAGLRATDDVIEQEGIRRTERQQARADLRLIVLDASALPTEAEWQALQAHMESFAHLPSMVLLNKMDQASGDAAAIVAALPEALRNYSIIFGSVTTGQGLSEAEHWIAHQLSHMTAGGFAHGVMLTRARHREALKEALEWLDQFLGTGQHLPLEIQCEQLRQAAQSIGKITGKILADDVLGVIFSEFCIGK